MSEERSPESYRVLARKYRPGNFAELIGQEALVRTLTNAIESKRLAHAFLLTGVRGVGKTTTARIIARALNCVGPDGTGGPTASPCGRCEHCTAIAEDRHVDVIEMDAASRTGVGDIRDLIEGVHYRPIQARTKVYVIDEVHMLSGPAFNALLKTLEEPPPHVTFVFATTEVRKVPVTVLSRCQRFDLRRVDTETLKAHFARIAEGEGARLEEGALALIARAADGSVRDGLSLLDQAIVHGAGQVKEAQVRDMLGLADRAQLFDLFEAVMRGEVEQALDLLSGLYAAGADPVVVVQDLLDLTHWLTRLKVVPRAGEELAVAEIERVRGQEIASKLSVPVLSRAWQMLLKGLGEAREAPRALQAVEMALIRLAYAADLPTPAEAIRSLGAERAPAGGDGGEARTRTPATEPAPTLPLDPPGPSSPNRPRAALATAPGEAERAEPMPASFAEVVKLAETRRELRLYSWLVNSVHLVRFERGRIEFRPGEGAPPELASILSEKLKEWTGARWVAVVSQAPGEPTLREQEIEEAERRKAEAAQSSAVQAVLKVFPGATIREVREVTESARSANPPVHLHGDESS